MDVFLKNAWGVLQKGKYCSLRLQTSHNCSETTDHGVRGK